MDKLTETAPRRRRGGSSKQKILEVAHQLVMERGLAGTSIDMILDAAAITKGAFFYHFRSKAHLAAELAKRYVDRDNNDFYALMQRAEKSTSGPMECLVAFLDMLGDRYATMDGLPGSLFASYAYGSHEPELGAFMDEHMRRWRGHYFKLLKRIAAQNPPQVDVDLMELADHFLAIVQGGCVLSRIYRDPKVVAVHLRHFRQYMQLVFDHR